MAELVRALLCKLPTVVFWFLLFSKHQRSRTHLRAGRPKSRVADACFIFSLCSPTLKDDAIQLKTAVEFHERKTKILRKSRRPTHHVQLHLTRRISGSQKKQSKLEKELDNWKKPVRLCQDFSSEDSRRENCLIVYLGILADTYRRRFGWIEAHRNDRLRYLPCLTTPSWCHHRHLYRR